MEIFLGLLILKNKSTIRSQTQDVERTGKTWRDFRDARVQLYCFFFKIPNIQSQKTGRLRWRLSFVSLTQGGKAAFDPSWFEMNSNCGLRCRTWKSFMSDLTESDLQGLMISIENHWNVSGIKATERFSEECWSLMYSSGRRAPSGERIRPRAVCYVSQNTRWENYYHYLSQSTVSGNTVRIRLERFFH